MVLLHLEKIFMMSKIKSVTLLADLTELEDHSINKIFSVATTQYINDFNDFAKDVKRILAPQGIISFFAPLATSNNVYCQLKNNNSLDKINIVTPVSEIVNIFNKNGFYAECNLVTDPSLVKLLQNTYITYIQNHIDYYICEMNNQNSNNNCQEERVIKSSDNIDTEIIGSCSIIPEEENI